MLTALSILLGVLLLLSVPLGYQWYVYEYLEPDAPDPKDLPTYRVNEEGDLEIAEYKAIEDNKTNNEEYYGRLPKGYFRYPSTGLIRNHDRSKYYWPNLDGTYDIVPEFPEEMVEIVKKINEQIHLMKQI